MTSNTEYKNQKAVDYILRCAIKEEDMQGIIHICTTWVVRTISDHPKISTTN